MCERLHVCMSACISVCTCLCTCLCACLRAFCACLRACVRVLWLLCASQGSAGEPRLWFLSIVCDERYPVAPPKIKFISRINADCVDGTGNVSDLMRTVGLGACFGVMREGTL